MPTSATIPTTGSTILGAAGGNARDKGRLESTIDDLAANGSSLRSALDRVQQLRHRLEVPPPEVVEGQDRNQQADWPSALLDSLSRHTSDQSALAEEIHSELTRLEALL